MAFVVGKKVGAPDATTVVFDVIDFGEIPVGMERKRATRLETAPADPTVKLSMDLETFNRLCCGRGDPAALTGGVKVEGDDDLGRRVIENMNFMV
jgi:hypothetical protein